MQTYKILELLKQMTLDEKVGQLIQITGEQFQKKEEAIITGPTSQLEIPSKMLYKIGSILNSNGAKESIEIQTRFLSRSRLKIPLLFMSDVINGYKTDLPIPLAQSCSWNVNLIQQLAKVAMKEASVAGVTVNYSPMLDLVRDARWGRVMESICGEDSYLGEVYGKAMVEAYQGDNIAKEGHGVACMKHFAAYGAAESGRDYNTVDMSERELRQYYLPAYQSAIKAGAKMVMTSFNTIKGVPSSVNEWLLKKLLREEWHFDGIIISDYSAIEETINHGVSENLKEASYKAIKAGVDIDMMSRCYLHYLKQLILEKRITESMIDTAVLRVLQLKNELGLFERPYGHASVEKEKQYFLCEEHREIARKGAAESFVLLKNKKQVLPLNQRQKIALIGPYGNNQGMSGAWSIYADRLKVVTIKQAIEKALGKDKVQYTKGSEILRQEEINPILEAEGEELVYIEKEEEKDKEEIKKAIKIANEADVIILAIGEHYKQTGEASSRTNIDLPQNQQNLLNALSKVGKPIVCILFGGRPLVVKPIVEKVDALLEVWFPGTEGGDAIADVIFGKVNPSGKLTMSFPQTVGQCPIYYNHYNTGRPNKKNLKFESRYQDVPTRSYYPFGYGLSYSLFSYKEIILSSQQISNATPTITVKVKIKNESNRGGYETVQLYIRDLYASVVRPVKELKGFQKIYFLPQEEKEVFFTITTDMLKFWNQELKYVIEEGKFRVYIGGNSEETLQAEFEYRE